MCGRSYRPGVAIYEIDVLYPILRALTVLNNYQLLSVDMRHSILFKNRKIRALSNNQK